MSQNEIRAEREELESDIERLRDKLDEAEERLHDLKHVDCKHPGLVRTGGTWPNTDDCPDCGMMFYICPNGEERFQ